MRVQVRRNVSVYEEYRKPFLSLLLKACDGAREAVGVNPRPYVKAESDGKTFDVLVVTDFGSMAEYEEKFLHSLLMNDDFLDGAESAVGMIVDNPRDELLVRLEPNDYFMHRKGGVDLEKLEASDEGEQKKYLLERTFRAKPGKLRDIMALNFTLMEEEANKTGTMPKYFCTRFTAGRIGASTQTRSFNKPIELDKQVIDYDTKFDHSLLNSPIEDVYYRRVDADLIDSFDAAEKPGVLVPQI
jgi:hypothetical protein